MAKKNHQATVESVKEAHKKVGAMRGGACLARHISKYDESNSCSHRWQAYKSASQHKGLYDWDKYAGVKSTKGKVRTDRKNGFPWWYRDKLNAPEPHDWDVGRGSNFKEKCYVPYWHNGHHLIPNGVLKESITAVGTDTPSPAKVRLNVKQGLLEAKYNLNYKVNMIVLPMDRAVGKALGMPVHLKAIFERSHGEYSKNVQMNVKQFFLAVRAALAPPCEEKPKPDYGYLKTQLESYSAHLFDAVSSAGAIDLDSMRADAFSQQKSDGFTG